MPGNCSAVSRRFKRKQKRAFARFVHTLNPKMFAKMIRTINIVKFGGTLVREPYTKHLDDGIFEVRSQVGNNLSRVLYFFFDGRKIVLTHGFTKKTQKTPSGEIARAKKYRDRYKEQIVNKKTNMQ